jgi:hypothetical protein
VKNLDEKLASLPSEPGVYLMKDTSGEVIYVGKAANLRNRVRSYFQDRTGDTRAFIPLLDRLLGDIEVVLVGTEKEALLLENELIKKHQPRFNVKLRDDKELHLLRLDARHPYPAAGGGAAVQKDGGLFRSPTPPPPPSASRWIINRFSGCGPAPTTCGPEATAATRSAAARPRPPHSAEQYRVWWRRCSSFGGAARTS